MENERVVCNALKSEEAQANDFRLAPQIEVLPSWPRRGSVSDFDGDLMGEQEHSVCDSVARGAYDLLEHADRVIRCSPDEDATNGFFVSCFARGPEREMLKRKHAENDGERSSTPKKRKKRKAVASI